MCTEKVFYKYRIINDYTIDSIANNYYYFSSPSQLNDINDSHIPLDLNLDKNLLLDWINKSGFNDYKDQIIKNYNSFTDKKFIADMQIGHAKLNEKLRIFCLSEVWDESQMWGYYADSYNGVCLGYKSYFNKNAYFIKVEKQNNPFILNDGDKKVMVLLKVDYNKTTLTPYNVFMQNTDVLIEAFRSKELKWSNEKEYRITFINTSDTDENKKIKYDKRNLTEVIFGIRTPKDKMFDVYNAIKNNYDLSRITFYRLTKEETMELKREEIPDMENIL